MLHFPFAFISWPFASIVIGVPRRPIHICDTCPVCDNKLREWVSCFPASRPQASYMPSALGSQCHHSDPGHLLRPISGSSQSLFFIKHPLEILVPPLVLGRESEVERPPPTPSLAQSDQRERLAGSCDSAWCLVVPDKQIRQEFHWERQVSFRRGK